VGRTFAEEQARNRNRIHALFVPLVLLHLIVVVLSVGVIVVATLNFGLWAFFLNPGGFPILLAAACLIAFVHYIFARNVLAGRLRDRIKADPPDAFDRYHRRAVNIVQELSIAAGLPAPELRIIPSFGINAFTLWDGGSGVVYVTEGAVSLLRRDELQAVIAHAIAHHGTGDTEAGTFLLAVAQALGFGARLRTWLEEDLAPTDWRLHASGYGRAYAGAFALEIVHFLSTIVASVLASFIGRDRRFLADTIAVELTRDPEALACALVRMHDAARAKMHIEWNALGLLCVAPPQYRVIDEHRGLMADLFSVHPPVADRVARISRYPLRVTVDRCARREMEVESAAEERYFAHRDGEWDGPFTLPELLALSWVNGSTWISPEDARSVNLAVEAPWFAAFLEDRGRLEKSPWICPACGSGLAFESYEGVRIERCSGCAGVVVDRRRIRKIQLREERPVPSAERRELAAILSGIRDSRFLADTNRTEPLRRCYRCRQEMGKTYFSSARPIVIDECPACALVYLDSGELEKLQARP
jgi:Zn-dependent protease with chaperone function/Zn-finger nucleic acid-binding protein